MKTAIVLRSVRGSQTTGQIQVEVIVLWMQRPPPLPLKLNRGSKLTQLPQCTLEITPPAALTGWKRDGSLWFLYSELQSLLNLSQFNFHEQSDMSARPGLFGWTRDEDGSKLRSPMDEGNRYTDCSRPRQLSSATGQMWKRSFHQRVPPLGGFPSGSIINHGGETLSRKPHFNKERQKEARWK